MSLIRKYALPYLLVLAFVVACGEDPTGPKTRPSSPSVVFEYEHPYPVTPLSEIWGAASDDIYAVGAYGVILHYDGTRWATMTDSQGRSLSDIWGVASDDVVAVGTDGLILHFDGADWRVEESGTDVLLRGVWGCAPDTFYTVGWAGKVLRYDGTAWDSLPRPPTLDLFSVWGTGGDNVYVGARDALLNFDGISWTDVGIQVRKVLVAIWGSSADDVWASDGTNWLWYFDGATWETVYTRILYPFTNLFGFASDDVFGIGTDGMVSHFGGSQWALNEVLDGYDLWGIWGTNAADLWVCGYSKPGTCGALFHYDGQGWTQTGQSLADGKLRDIWSDASGERVFAVGGDKILRKEGGQWVLEPITPPWRLWAVWGAPTGEVFAVGENSLCFRFDGGSWQDIGPDKGGLRFDDVWGTSKDNVYVVANDGLWKYNGAGWDAPAAVDYVRAVWGADESNVFSAGIDTLLHGVVRRFNGNSWETIYDESTTWVQALTGVGPRDLLIRADETDSGRQRLLRYDGTEWRDVTPSQLSNFLAIAGNTRHGYLVAGYNVQDQVGTDEILLRMENNRWEVLNPPFGAEFRGMWGGLDQGFYLVGRSQIVRCVLK